MSDINLDVNELINSLSAEVATVTRRAIIAEANASARDKVIKELREERVVLTDRVTHLEGQVEELQSKPKKAASEERPDFD